MAIRLPLIRPELDPVDHIEIPTPCSVPWDSMYGDQRIRHCGSCRKDVYNVSELTRAEAMALIASREPVCLRIYRRPDGTVVTNDCWSRLRAARRRGGMWALVAMLATVRWVRLVAMFVGIAGLWRLIRHAPTSSSPVAPVTAGTPVARNADPPYPDDGFAAGSHLPMPEVEPIKGRVWHQKPAKHAEPSAPEEKTIKGRFILGRRRVSP
jgi:hypothetical protein